MLKLSNYNKFRLNRLKRSMLKQVNIRRIIIVSILTIILILLNSISKLSQVENSDVVSVVSSVQATPTVEMIVEPSITPVVTIAPTSVPTVIPVPTATIQPRKANVTSRGSVDRNVVSKDAKVDVNFKYIDSFVGDVTMYTLAYNECKKYPSHPEYGITASGIRVKPNFTVAMGKNVPFGTKIRIEGFSTTYTNMDTGNLIFSKSVDIYTTNLNEAVKWGRQQRKVYIISYGTGKIK